MPKEGNVSWLTIAKHAMHVWVPATFVGLVIDLDDNHLSSAVINIELLREIDG